jgi:hypothetical protein
MNLDYFYVHEWISVHHGKWSRTLPDRDRETIFIDDVALGDITGDGVEEAAILWDANGGGTETFYYVDIVALRNGRPVVVQRLREGESCVRALAAVKIVNGNLLLCVLGSGYPQSYPECANPGVQTWKWNASRGSAKKTGEVEVSSNVHLDHSLCFSAFSSQSRADASPDN